MSLKTISFFTIIIISIFLFFIFAPINTIHKNSDNFFPKKIFLSLENNKVNEKTIIHGKYFYEKGINSIELGSQKINCFNSKECEFKFEKVFSKPGTQEIKLVLNSQDKLFELKEIIQVFDSKKCVNGVAFGECLKSNYCNKGVIEFNCVKCPCEKGFSCIGNNCVLTDLNLGLNKLNAPQIVGENQVLKISFSLKNNSETVIPKNTRLIVKLFNNSKLVSTQQVIYSNESTLGSVDLFSVSFPLTGLGSGVREFFLELSLDSGKKVLVSPDFNIRIIPFSDSPPLAPIGLVAESFDNSVDLSWSSIDSTVVSFNVYESVSVQSTHISYSFTGFTDLNSFSFDFLEPGVHYFVVTSVNVFGSESKYSNPVKIVVG